MRLAVDLESNVIGEELVDGGVDEVVKTILPLIRLSLHAEVSQDHHPHTKKNKRIQRRTKLYIKAAPWV
jgi:hypothetical protein